MAKKLDPAISEVLKKFGFGPEAAWDCHGTWVVYHRVLEQIAAKAKIRFDAPQILEANGPAKSVALCVKGCLYGEVLGDAMAEEWSIGEASPANNKNGYPYAMAEKRAKDRVILKLIGLHGLAYSEDEADDFKDSAPKTEAPQARSAVITPLPESLEPDPDTQASIAYVQTAIQIISVSKQSEKDLRQWWADESGARREYKLTQAQVSILLGKLKEKIEGMAHEVAA